MINFSVNNKMKVVIVTIVFTMIVFLYPFLTSIFYDADISSLWMDSSLGIKHALYNTCMFSFVSSCINTIGGLQLSILIRNVSTKTKVGVALSILLLPVILGNVTISYIYKTSLYGSVFGGYIIGSGGLMQMVIFVFIHFWQYGLLFTYLFWLIIRQIPASRYDYSSSLQMTEKEIVRDIVLPPLRSLFVLLFLINMMFSFYESAKCQFVFKTSQGMDSEFISQALYRIYQLYSVINPVMAKTVTMKNGIVLAILLVIILVCCVKIIISLFSCFRKSVPLLLYSSKCGNKVAFVCIILVLIPIIIAFSKSRYALSLVSFSQMPMTFLLTIVSAMFATGIAVIFGIATRMLLGRKITESNRRVVSLFLPVFLLQLIPPICIMVCGYYWLGIIGYNDIVTYLVWIWGHPLLVFPILSSFVIATHFVVGNDELEWNMVHKLNSRDIIKFSFLKRFRKEYALTFLFAFAFIWNDVTLNKILSDEIPSFAEKMQRLFIGRATNDEQATLYAIFAILMAIASIMLWNNVMKGERYSKFK